jgi:hypothetical protein
MAIPHSVKAMIQKPTFYIPVSIAVLSIGAYVYKYHYFSAPSAEEFFARNPQLQNSIEMVKATPTPTRSDDEFKPGDFKLEKDKGYKINIKTNFSNLAEAKNPFTSTVTGQMILASFGIEKGLLWFIASVEISANNKEKNANDATSKNEFLVGLYPQGEIRKLFTKGSPLNYDRIGAFYELLDLAFRRIEDKSIGKRLVKWPDPSMKAINVEQEVSNASEREIQITLKFDVKQKPFGASETRSAAQGAPGLGPVYIEQQQKGIYQWTWRTDLSRPTKQFIEAESKINMTDTVLGHITTTYELNWSSETKGIQDLLKRRKEFKYEVNLNSLIAYNRLKNQLEVGKSKNAQKLSVRPYENIVKDLKQLNKNTFTEIQKDQILIDLSHQLRANPNLVQNVYAQAKDASGGSRERSILLGALAYEGGPAAQKAMIDIYRADNATFEDKSKIMIDFVIANKPLTKESKEFIKSEYETRNPLNDDLGNSAGLAMGTAIAYDGDPELVKYVKKQYVSNDHLITNPPEEISSKKYVLAIMGNSKSDVFEKEVTSAANSGEKQLIVAAASSARFAQTPSMRDLLINILGNHTDPSVRKAAIDAMAFQPFDQMTQDALTKCATNEKHLPTRLACYNVLTKHIDFPYIHQFIVSRQGSESDEQILNLIGAALSTKSSK